MTVGLVLLLLAAALAGPAAASAALSVTDMNGGVTATDMAGALTGTGVTIDSTNYIGAPNASGLFSGGADIVGIDSGVVLSSGNAAGVIGPNDQGGHSRNNNRGGDAALDALVGGGTRDASVLEVEFTPNADTVYFQYVFGSEEYSEYVNTSFNDVFAFFVNGDNCALVGDPAEHVSIDTINQGKNAGLFVNNEPPAHNTQMDGFTIPLTCESAMTPNAVNTLRMAIADRGDYIVDSWVLIGAGTLSTEPPTEPPTATRSGARLGSGPTTRMPSRLRVSTWTRRTTTCLGPTWRATRLLRRCSHRRRRTAARPATMWPTCSARGTPVWPTTVSG